MKMAQLFLCYSTNLLGMKELYESLYNKRKLTFENCRSGNEEIACEQAPGWV